MAEQGGGDLTDLYETKILEVQHNCYGGCWIKHNMKG